MTDGLPDPCCEMEPDCPAVPIGVVVLPGAESYDEAEARFSCSRHWPYP